MTLLRCGAGKAAGKFKVELLVLHSKEEVRVQIGSHHDVFQYGPDGLGVREPDGTTRVLDAAPTVSTKEPFVGELCPCEFDFLSNGVPGKDYRPEYQFTVTKAT